MDPTGGVACAKATDQQRASNDGVAGQSTAKLAGVPVVESPLGNEEGATSRTGPSQLNGRAEPWPTRAAPATPGRRRRFP